MPSHASRGRVPDEGEQVVVTRDEDEHRWEARIGDGFARFTAYQQTDELVVFTHTEVARPTRPAGQRRLSWLRIPLWQSRIATNRTLVRTAAAR